jgi:hypothetical protein
MKQVPLVKQEQHGHEMNNQPQFRRLRFYIIGKADERDEGEPRKKPGIGKSAPIEPKQYTEVKNHAAATQGDVPVRTALVGFVDDVVTIGYSEIDEHECKKQDEGDKVSKHVYDFWAK